MKAHSYPKAEKLKSEKDIALLFKKGKWRTSGHVRMVFLKLDDNGKTKIGVSASKKHLKNAVDRNHAKRLLREAYRLNKQELNNAFEVPILAMFFWASNDKPKRLSDVEREVLDLIRKK